MAKYYGKIGFSISINDGTGIWEEKIQERIYSGDLIKNFSRNNSTNKVVEDISISNNISILADPYAYENFHHIRYVTFMGSKWKVSSIEVQYPRLILEIGGLYNE